MSNMTTEERIRRLTPPQRAYLTAQLDAFPRPTPARSGPATAVEDVEKELVAFVVSQGGRTPDERTLREDLRRRIPDFMIPSRFVWMDDLPKTPNGKVDRPKLNEWRERAMPSIKSLGNDKDDVAVRLRGIWSEVLRTDRIGDTDDFFELGGHSLLAIQILSRIRERFEIELPLRTIFEVPTIAGLSDEIRQKLQQRS